MSKDLEGVAPDSLEAQAIADLEKEGHQVGDHQPINDEGEADEPKGDDKPEITSEEADKKEAPVEAGRTPTMVEAWKLKVAEDQKASAIKQVDDLQKKLEELSKQKEPITNKQSEDIAEDIRLIAEESNVDASFLEKFANTILKRAESKTQLSSELAETLKNLKEEKELAKQETRYLQDFAKDIEPLVKDQYGLSETALSQLRSQLKDLAFSETYAKVPLAKIFKAEFDTFGIKEGKRSSEGKGVRVRAGEVVDVDNLTEDQLDRMTPEQLEQFEQKHSSGWNRPK